jgi:hypothetical protein
MSVTAGHDCVHDGCRGLALYGMRFNGEARWACLNHRHLIGFTERPAASTSQSDAGADAGARPAPGRAAGVHNAPAAIPSRFPSQGRLI